MITEKILGALFAVADFFLGLLPEIDLAVNTSAWNSVGDVLSMVLYLLPLQTIVNVVSLVIAIGFFRITVAFIKFILQIVPFF